MRTLVKKISLSLIIDLIKAGTLKNNHCSRVLAHSVFRYDSGIEQETLFAIENLDGSYEVLDNEIIAPLLIKLENSNDQVYNRKLKMLTFNICILDCISSNSDKTLFKILTSK